MFNIYCDESCHLENDNSDIMVLGALTCPEDLKSKVYNDVRDLKLKHGISTWFEIKWTKVSDSKLSFYIDLIQYFFDKEYLQFRGVVATGKDRLDHSIYNDNNYDLWYYKMYFQLLDPITLPPNEYKIFIDIKDTKGGAKVRKLHEVLCSNKYDYNREIIKDIKQIHSNESEIMQLSDLLIGAISFFNRGLYDAPMYSTAKKTVIDEIIRSTNISLAESTSKWESKFNLFIWYPRTV
jgi:Protein of unknown function (DUF3800)